ncbi:unnamed protein product [Closterium sp. NIES-65]|nr:unnamed protein product [Closterium sp. NIES-65]
MAASRERSAPPDPAAEAADSESLRTAEEIVGSRAPPAIGAAVDAHLLRSFDGLARDLDHAIRTAATPSQQHDAIATCLLIANALCDWPESDEPRPREAFGFRVLRSMPCAAESLLLRGKPWVARVCCDAGEVRGEGRDTFFLMEHSSSSRRRAAATPWRGFCGPQGSSHVPATATTPAALSPLLPAGLRAPFLTQLEVASSQVDRTAKRQRSQGGMLARQHSQEDVEQLHNLRARRFFLLLNHPLSHRPPPPPPLPRSLSQSQSQSSALPLVSPSGSQPQAVTAAGLQQQPMALSASGSQPCSPSFSSSAVPMAQSAAPTHRFCHPLSLVLISSTASHTPPPTSTTSAFPSLAPAAAPAALPAPTAASPTPTVNAWELYSHVKAYLARRAGGNGSGDGSAEGSAEGSGDGSGEGSGEEEAQALWRVVRACGVESVGELSGVVDERGWTAMHVAARNGDSPVLQALLRMGMPAGVCSTRNATTPLHLAAYGGHVDCMCLLAVTSAHIRADGCGADIRADGCGADIRARTAGGWTPLHNAASQQQWGAVRWLAQQGIEPAEVEAAGGNPNANRLPAHLMAQAVQIVREEYARRLGHAGEGGHGFGEEAGVDGGARQSAEGDGDGGKRPRKRRWDGGKGGDARAVTAADDPLAPVSGAPMAAREGGGLAAGGADGSRDGADDSGDGADGSSDGADGSSDDADVERIESGSSSGCIAVERWRLHCRKKSEKVERRTKRRAQVRENVAARRGVGMGVAAAPPGAGGAVNSGIISSGGSGGGGVSVEELGAVFGLRAGALVARAALPHILAGEALLSPTSLLVLPWKPRWKP